MAALCNEVQVEHALQCSWWDADVSGHGFSRAAERSILIRRADFSPRGVLGSFFLKHTPGADVCVLCGYAFFSTPLTLR
jgi:hypothetical protein